MCLVNLTRILHVSDSKADNQTLYFYLEVVKVNKSVHLLLGMHIYAYVKEKYGIYLDRESFLFGNILPDLCLNFMIKPHILENYSTCLQSRIQNLLNSKSASAIFGKRYSRQLGIICHYYADYFCYPHRQDYSGDIVSHVRYEKALNRYLQREVIRPYEQSAILEWHKETDERMLYQNLCTLQKNYLHNDPSFENDIKYSIKACVEVLINISSTSLMAQPHEYELCYPANTLRLHSQSSTLSKNLAAMIPAFGYWTFTTLPHIKKA